MSHPSRGWLRGFGLVATAALITAAGRHLKSRRAAVRETLPELRSAHLYVDMSFTRAWMLPVLAPLMQNHTEVVPSVVARRTALSQPGASLVIYQPEHPTAGRGAVLWLHGGGHIMGSAAGDHALCSTLARDLDLTVVSVDYRVAPCPDDLEDCWEALNWLHQHAGELGVDSARIAVAGASAGGGLAASLAQRARDEQLEVCFQLLVYPMLDDNTGQQPDPNGRGKLVISPAVNRLAWQVYLGHPAGQPEMRPYAVPARCADLSGLPPAWIGVGDLDLFHDEAVAYAERLCQAGVECELLVVPRMYHGADVAAPPGPVDGRLSGGVGAGAASPPLLSWAATHRPPRPRTGRSRVNHP